MTTPREDPIEALAELLFAYINKDEDMPHSFELTAVNQAVDILLAEYHGEKYNRDFFLRCRSILERKINENEGRG